MKKKFCFIVTDAVSFNVLYRGQLEYLARSGIDLTLICGGEASEIEVLRERNVGKVIKYGLIRKPQVLLDLLSLSRLFWHLLFNRYDVVLVTTPKALLLGSIAAFLTSQRRTVSFFQGRVYENFKGLKRKIYVFLDCVVVYCTREVVFVSKSLMAEFLKDVPSADKKGRVIGEGSGNGVCLDQFSPSLSSVDEVSKIRSRLGLTYENFVVLSVGRICEDKGINEAMKVAGLVADHASNVRFVLVGSVEDGRLLERLAPLMDKGLVIHVDFVDDVAPYFELADIHLFLSHREGFGNVAIEAAAMGVPTIAFDVVGVRDSVAEEVSGLRFKLGDSKSVSEAIIEFAASDPEIVKERFKDSRSWAVKNFSNEMVWENYKNFYLGIDC